MKIRDLETELRKRGWWLQRHGAKHDIWTNGEDIEPVPRHTEIKEWLARKIIKVAQAALERQRSENNSPILEKSRRPLVDN